MTPKPSPDHRCVKAPGNRNPRCSAPAPRTTRRSPSTRQGRVAAGGYPPTAPTDPDALPEDPDDFLCGARAASLGVEKTRPPRFLGCLAAPHWPLAGHRPATRRHPPTSPRSCVGPAGATRPRFPSILLVDSVCFVVRAPQRPCCLYHSGICFTPSTTPSRVHPSCTRRSESRSRTGVVRYTGAPARKAARAPRIGADTTS